MALSCLLLQRIVVGLINGKPFIRALLYIEIDLFDKAFGTSSLFCLPSKESQVLDVVVGIASLKSLVVHA